MYKHPLVFWSDLGSQQPRILGKGARCSSIPVYRSYIRVIQELYRSYTGFLLGLVPVRP